MLPRLLIASSEARARALIEWLGLEGWEPRGFGFATMGRQIGQAVVFDFECADEGERRRRSAWLQECVVTKFPPGATNFRVFN